VHSSDAVHDKEEPTKKEVLKMDRKAGNNELEMFEKIRNNKKTHVSKHECSIQFHFNFDRFGDVLCFGGFRKSLFPNVSKLSDELHANYSVHARTRSKPCL